MFKTDPVDEKKLLEWVEKSFYGVYYFMMSALVITFISAFIVQDAGLRRILMIEIIITGVSTFMYYLFTSNISQYFNTVQVPGTDINLNVVNILRYNGWAITTPLMLIALCLVLSSSTKVPLNPILVFTIILLDYIMLLLGYLGELGIMDRFAAMVLGFIPLIIIFYLIFSAFMINTINPFNYIIYFIYVIIWAGYGVAYILDDKTKNIVTNIFDGIAKGLVAILLSLAYLSW